MSPQLTIYITFGFLLTFFLYKRSCAERDLIETVRGKTRAFPTAATALRYIKETLKKNGFDEERKKNALRCRASYRIWDLLLNVTIIIIAWKAIPAIIAASL